MLYKRGAAWYNASYRTEGRCRRLRIRVEIAQDRDEEIVIRCRERNDRIRLLESVVESTLGSGGVLALSIGDTEYYIPKSDVLFFESLGGKVCAHTVDGMYVTPYRLFELEGALPACFLRISKSAVVNVMPISSMRRELSGGGLLTFRETKKTVRFSRAYAHRLRALIEELRFGIASEPSAEKKERKEVKP